MLATGRIRNTAFSSNALSDLLGFEYVGFDMHGQRIMGMCAYGGISNVCVPDKYLSWEVPDKWTLEDAATVPCVYSTCYCALYMHGKIKRRDKVLIHSGSGGVGQAAIYLALYEGCEVFTTVGTEEKRQFIRETFPSIPEENIGNSRDTSFEQMIMQRTKGRGVDIVLNSLAEEKLQASVRCLANGGRFLEIGKYDMVSNNPLDTSVFYKGINFHSILLDNFLFKCPKTVIRLQEAITDYLEKGIIKPLSRKIFKRNEVEAAFRYMASGKHIGKVK
ncbi:PREDICTED: fatty acid synthase-like [Vollenhovia emeryi]|uniref:fatty acid synthase-like n=1 Tax=Vollenhovia emeryi TaxID=411798 RepID=UPI0005F3E70F|nr:PREDICTED: fatty acid synthase-like [Vollenhovia emeryi]